MNIRTSYLTTNGWSHRRVGEDHLDHWGFSSGHSSIMLSTLWQAPQTQVSDFSTSMFFLACAQVSELDPGSTLEITASRFVRRAG